MQPQIPLWGASVLQWSPGSGLIFLHRAAGTALSSLVLGEIGCSLQPKTGSSGTRRKGLAQEPLISCSFSLLPLLPQRSSPLLRWQLTDKKHSQGVGLTFSPWCHMPAVCFAGNLMYVFSLFPPIFGSNQGVVGQAAWARTAEQ